MENKRVTRKEWYSEHQACPDCDNTKLMITLAGVIEDPLRDFEDNINTAECKCGWYGPVKELLPPLK